MERRRFQTLLGAIIRQQRELAAVPMRQLAEAVGISKPYLSQIERGLRAPSDAVLNAIADTLDLTTAELYERAGIVDMPRTSNTDHGLQQAIESANELTAAQRRAMVEIYHGFLNANVLRRVHPHPNETGTGSCATS